MGFCATVFSFKLVYLKCSQLDSNLGGFATISSPHQNFEAEVKIEKIIFIL